MPILIALYRVFFTGISIDPATGTLLEEQLAHLYPVLRDAYGTIQINTTFLGIVDLTKNHNIVLAVLAGVSQFFSSKLLATKKAPIKTKGAKDENMTAMLNKQMLYFMPIITIVFGYQFPAGVTLYWLTNTVFTLGQQLIMLKMANKSKDDDEGEKPKDIIEHKPDKEQKKLNEADKQTNS